MENWQQCEHFAVCDFAKASKWVLWILNATLPGFLAFYLFLFLSWREERVYFLLNCYK